MKDGGKAFPASGTMRSDIANSPTWRIEASGGMTLRDYFAAAALQGWLATFGDCPHPAVVFDGDTDARDDRVGRVAALSYRLADAMLAEREK